MPIKNLHRSHFLWTNGRGHEQKPILYSKKNDNLGLGHSKHSHLTTHASIFEDAFNSTLKNLTVSTTTGENGETIVAVANKETEEEKEERSMRERVRKMIDRWGAVGGWITFVRGGVLTGTREIGVIEKEGKEDNRMEVSRKKRKHVEIEDEGEDQENGTDMTMEPGNDGSNNKKSKERNVSKKQRKEKHTDKEDRKKRRKDKKDKKQAKKKTSSLSSVPQSPKVKISVPTPPESSIITPVNESATHSEPEMEKHKIKNEDNAKDNDADKTSMKSSRDRKIGKGKKSKSKSDKKSKIDNGRKKKEKEK